LGIAGDRAGVLDTVEVGQDVRTVVDAAQVVERAGIQGGGVLGDRVARAQVLVVPGPASESAVLVIPGDPPSQVLSP
jgi:hypothetical protein